MKLTIIGSGNMGGSIAKGLAKGKIVSAADITCTALSDTTLEKMRAANPDFVLTHDNREAVRGADVVILAVKPWKVEAVIDEIRPALDFEKQVFVSVAAGITSDQLVDFLSRDPECGGPAIPAVFIAMPNTAIEVGSGVTFLSPRNASKGQIDLVVSLFNELGYAQLIEERLISAGSALASCGIAFALRYIRAAIAGGVELGFYPQQAQELVAHTVRGAVDLLLTNKSDPEAEIDKVTTPGGFTIRGLNEMEHAGFTSAVIRGLKASRY